MKVSSLLDNGFTAIALPDGSRVIDGVYIGDLLSWVMGSATSNDAWITIMSNINVLAVATLTDVSCVILAEGVSLEEEIIREANNKGINIVSTDLTAYNAALKLSELLK